MPASPMHGRRSVLVAVGLLVPRLGVGAVAAMALGAKVDDPGTADLLLNPTPTATTVPTRRPRLFLAWPRLRLATAPCPASAMPPCLASAAPRCAALPGLGCAS
eukprot:CAMPEP_0172538534 /NCGR_PEP_ID=MMETSP1067-20121228/9903_1 /TAXON_ID=265564 ORGANISM="Thalassiosira punctigera, Strain Tpunct2005C2" /NCGR_SAMPLE_ID=MMETSP1067 /ASSEMBLY_ACC=CAM_ASM_000444 /LENGTH=103 /DNA_ID=CAMNT_0013324045 /DNA_START=35 /DNA_END=344 /DNA_ORIENTATION=-